MHSSAGERPLLWPLIGTTVFVLFVGPGPVIVLVPYLLTGWNLAPAFFGWETTRWLGVVTCLAAAPLLANALVGFVRRGQGTPAPVAPPRHLVVAGVYRYVRNPMYIGVLAMIVGQGVFLASVVVLLYAAGVALAFHLFVVLYEEPALRRKFGDNYRAYCKQVPRWLPRWRAAGLQ
ncbi:MAG: isoprenylcysteine carboxylmethyltransferase family protein [Deltaproteobacteria bacterium]|nr:isoprenylcysteine carboxylmethyltransferase family protein [Deltaproteobacteria bacterium]